jgi:hypothetical protein
MANYAVIEEGLVVNVIVADSKEIAEEVTGKTCIEYTEENPSGIDWTWDGTSFIMPQPYPSWILNSDKIWEAPVAKPSDDKNYVWNEETTSWQEVVVEVTE